MHQFMLCCTSLSFNPARLTYSPVLFIIKRGKEQRVNRNVYCLKRLISKLRHGGQISFKTPWQLQSFNCHYNTLHQKQFSPPYLSSSMTCHHDVYYQKAFVSTGIKAVEYSRFSFLHQQVLL